MKNRFEILLPIPKRKSFILRLKRVKYSYPRHFIRKQEIHYNCMCLFRPRHFSCIRNRCYYCYHIRYCCYYCNHNHYWSRRCSHIHCCCSCFHSHSHCLHSRCSRSHHCCTRIRCHCLFLREVTKVGSKDS